MKICGIEILQKAPTRGSGQNIKFRTDTGRGLREVNSAFPTTFLPVIHFFAKELLTFEFYFCKTLD